MTTLGADLEAGVVNYKASPTLARFFADDSFVRLVIGPFGSGKSSGSVIEILRRASQQRKAPDGIRYSRFAVIRNSYRELSDTARKTFHMWIPESLGEYSVTDATFTLRINDIHCEVLFRALDTPEDIKKLKSLELTGAWINEASEIPQEVFEVLQTRVGRYPPMLHGGPTWRGVWLDTNPPDSDHWIYELFEEKQPEGHSVYHQPSGLAENAENIENLDGGRAYYTRVMAGKDPAWIDVYVHGKYGFIKDGKPVFPEFNMDMHAAKGEIEIIKNSMLFLGMDFGLTPAIVVGQKHSSGQLQIIDEFTSASMGAVNFAREVAATLRTKYPTNSFVGWGDPAGSQRSQVDERTPFEVVNGAGLPIDPALTNDFVKRREAVGYLLSKLTLSATPGMIVSHKNCPVLVKALAGGHCFKRVQVSGEKRFKDKPDKNRFSHVSDALQYLCVGLGYDDRALDGDPVTDLTGIQKSTTRKVLRAYGNSGPRRR